MRALADAVLNDVHQMKHDMLAQRFEEKFGAHEQFRRYRRPPGPTPLTGGVPVTPNNPFTLSGGAAAELDFDE